MTQLHSRPLQAPCSRPTEFQFRHQPLGSPPRFHTMHPSYPAQTLILQTCPLGSNRCDTVYNQLQHEPTSAGQPTFCIARCGIAFQGLKCHGTAVPSSARPVSNYFRCLFVCVAWKYSGTARVCSCIFVFHIFRRNISELFGFG